VGTAQSLGPGADVGTASRSGPGADVGTAGQSRRRCGHSQSVRSRRRCGHSQSVSPGADVGTAGQSRRRCGHSPVRRSRRRCGHRRVLLACKHCQLSLARQVRIIDETNVGRPYTFGLGIEHMFVHSTAADPGTHAEPGVTYKKAGTDRAPPASSPPPSPCVESPRVPQRSPHAKAKASKASRTFWC
jgi:hypothetical protein